MERLTPGLIYMAVFRCDASLGAVSFFASSLPRLHPPPPPPVSASFSLPLPHRSLPRRHPVQEFLDTWKKMDLTKRLQEKAADATLTLEDFLAKPDYYLSLMSDETLNVRHHLVDRQVYRMGKAPRLGRLLAAPFWPRLTMPLGALPGFPREQYEHGHVLYMMKHLWWFAFTGIAEYLEESMVSRGAGAGRSPSFLSPPSHRPFFPHILFFLDYVPADALLAHGCRRLLQRGAVERKHLAQGAGFA